MFDHELEAAIADYELLGTESPTLRRRIQHLHRIVIVTRAHRGDDISADVQAIERFLEQMRPFDLLADLPNSYPRVTLQDLLPRTDATAIPSSPAKLLRVTKTKRKRKKKRRNQHKRPKLIFTAFESSRRRH